MTLVQAFLVLGPSPGQFVLAVCRSEVHWCGASTIFMDVRQQRRGPFGWLCGIGFSRMTWPWLLAKLRRHSHQLPNRQTDRLFAWGCTHPKRVSGESGTRNVKASFFKGQHSKPMRREPRNSTHVPSISLSHLSGRPWLDVFLAKWLVHFQETFALFCVVIFCVV